MELQKCYKCLHNNTGEIILIDGKEVCKFDCNLKSVDVIQDFKKECKDFKEEVRHGCK